MINPNQYKEEITRQVAIELRTAHPTIDVPLDEAMDTWWCGKRSGGFSLSTAGHTAFRLAGLQCYDYPIKLNPSYSVITQLNRKLKVPYYISLQPLVKLGFGTISIYDGKTAMVLRLYDDLEKFLDSIGAWDN
tara:strand:+ start:160 stop:558 length:399 start_codon:yes stop_codon:yes gene_type:complete